MSIKFAPILMAAAPTPALASASASETLSLKIEGHISPRCSLDLGRREVDIVLLPTPGQTSLPLQVDCNERLTVSMTSQNGGLLHAAHARGARYPGFTGFLPYQAIFSIHTDGARPLSAYSTAMQGAGAGGTTGAAPYRAAGAFQLSWAPTEELLAGDYRDIIEIRISGAGESAAEYDPDD